MGYVPHQLVMATSVYSLGVTASIGALFRSISRGELPEVTQLIYQARENALELIRHVGIEPHVVQYLKTPPSRTMVAWLAERAGKPLRNLLREKGTPYAELGLDDSKWNDEQLIGFMLQHPILINRPIVVTPLGTRLCRPSELVLDILVQAQQGPFTKEDGEVVIDEQGRRLV